MRQMLSFPCRQEEERRRREEEMRRQQEEMMRRQEGFKGNFPDAVGGCFHGVGGFGPGLVCAAGGTLTRSLGAKNLRGRGLRPVFLSFRGSLQICGWDRWAWEVSEQALAWCSRSGLGGVVERREGGREACVSKRLSCLRSLEWQGRGCPSCFWRRSAGWAASICSDGQHPLKASPGPTAWDCVSGVAAVLEHRILLMQSVSSSLCPWLCCGVLASQPPRRTP